MAWGLALLIAATAAVLEAVLSGRRPFAYLASLRQPRWALPTAGWLAVGASFYIIMTVALARLLDSGQLLPALLVIAILITDAFWNFVLFRLRRLDWAYLYLYPYAGLVCAGALAALAADLIAGGLLMLYLLFLPYDFAWAHALTKLNPRPLGRLTKADA